MDWWLIPFSVDLQTDWCESSAIHRYKFIKSIEKKRSVQLVLSIYFICCFIIYCAGEWIASNLHAFNDVGKQNYMHFKATADETFTRPKILYLTRKFWRLVWTQKHIATWKYFKIHQKYKWNELENYFCHRVSRRRLCQVYPSPPRPIPVSSVCLL